MDSNTQLKTTFEPEKVIQPIFTRGNVALSRDGRILASCIEEDTILTDLQTGAELAKIEGVGNDISPSGSILSVYLTERTGWRDCNKSFPCELSLHHFQLCILIFNSNSVRLTPYTLLPIIVHANIQIESKSRK
jgi:hypothetical protein